MARHRVLLAAFLMQPDRPAGAARPEVLDFHLQGYCSDKANVGALAVAVNQRCQTYERIAQLQEHAMQSKPRQSCCATAAWSSFCDRRHIDVGVHRFLFLTCGFSGRRRLNTAIAAMIRRSPEKETGPSASGAVAGSATTP